MRGFTSALLALALAFGLVASADADMANIGYQQPLSHNYLNSLVQSTDLVTDLRAFAGTTVPASLSGCCGSMVYARGRAAVGDGGGGLFYWNAASSASDNGTTIIQPTSVSGNGRWIMLSVAAPGTAAYKTVTETANYTVLTTDVGTWFDNNGAVGPVILTLPVAESGLHYCASVISGNMLTFAAVGSDVIVDDGATGAPAGNVGSNSPGNQFCVHARGAGAWYVDRGVGILALN